jgi:hypothetical protein
MNWHNFSLQRSDLSFPDPKRGSIPHLALPGSDLAHRHVVCCVWYLSFENWVKTSNNAPGWVSDTGRMSEL